jgi:hypothetical protein
LINDQDRYSTQNVGHRMTLGPGRLGFSRSELVTAEFDCGSFGIAPNDGTMDNEH